jgi:hypothetical protein
MATTREIDDRPAEALRYDAPAVIRREAIVARLVPSDSTTF